jgi:hypothetical protein
MGKHHLGNMTENGSLLTKFCVIHDLIIGGFLFAYKKGHKVTWASPDTTTENQNDHVCICRKWRRFLEDVRIKRSANIGSDYHLVIAEIKIKIARVFEEKLKRKRYDTQKLKNDVTKTTFVQEWKSNLKKMPPPEINTDINTYWNSVKESLLNTCERLLGPIQNRRK